MPTIYHSTIFKPVLVQGQVTFQIRKGVVQSFISGCLQFSGFISIALTCFALPHSTGLYAAIASSSSLVTAVFLYLTQNETLSFWQGLGLFICTVGLVLGCVQSKTEAQLSAVLVAVLSLFLFSARHFLIRQAQHLNLDAVTATIVTNLAHGFIGVMAWVCWTLNSPQTTTDSYYWRGVAAGALIAVSAYCLNLSIYKGPTGPAALISNLYFLTFSLSDFSPNDFTFNYEKLPSLLVVAGGLVVLLGCDWLCRWIGCRRYSSYSSLEQPLIPS
jgi:drug/metabolite transporter (DMT)-like permease